MTHTASKLPSRNEFDRMFGPASDPLERMLRTKPSTRPQTRPPYRVFLVNAAGVATVELRHA